MSDKKQSSVDWIMNRLRAFDKNAYNELYEDYKLAKAIHQQEHENAFLEGAKCYREGQAWTDQGFREFSRIVYTENFGE